MLEPHLKEKLPLGEGGAMLIFIKKRNEASLEGESVSLGQSGWLVTGHPTAQRSAVNCPQLLFLEL